MNVHLDSELEHLIERLVQTGHYHSAADVIREGLQLLEERDRILALRREDVHQRIVDGLEALRLGKGVDGDTVFDRIESELDETDRIEAIVVSERAVNDHGHTKDL
jgi:antitoxin ParD1/3/4